jgi:hypothetical protein
MKYDEEGGGRWKYSELIIFVICVDGWKRIWKKKKKKKKARVP